MNRTAQLFFDIGEPLAAGFFEEENASVAKRFCRGYRRFYESCATAVSRPDSPLYPSGAILHGNVAVLPQHCRQYAVDWKLLESKSPEAAGIFAEFCRIHGAFLNAEGKDDVLRYSAYIDAWHHSALDYRRINAEGLDRYEERVREMKNEDLREALLDVLIGIRRYHARSIEYLVSVHGDQKLIDALKKVPFGPAETAYEALVGTNFMLYLDGYDNMGYVDAWLPTYWKGEDLTELLSCMMGNLEACGGWSVTVGPTYSDLTKQWIRASKGHARPMIELRTASDMPDDIW